MGCLSQAQVPDLNFIADLRLSYRSANGGDSRIRLYDAAGVPSVIGFRFNLEPGLRGKVTQKFERIRNDGDRDSLDEYFVEAPRLWRVGKQYLPFGSGQILRESVLGARFDTQLVIDALPISIAVADAGKQKTRGVTARVGRRLGASVAVGDHFGISSTSLTQIRRPEESPGSGRGYGLMYGIDYFWVVNGIQIGVEAIQLLRGATITDRSQNLTDFRIMFGRATASYYRFGWTRLWGEKHDFYRLETETKVTDQASILGYLRFSRGEWQDFGLTVRYRF